MPITPVPETPPVTIARHAIDWTEQLDALVAQPGEWFKVDGPLKTSQVSGRFASFEKFGAARGHAIETNCPKTAEERWLYARLVEGEPDTPAKPAPAPKPIAAVPDPAPAKPPSPHGDFGGDLECDDCDATFRTNHRLRQHQTNAHKTA